MPVVKNTQLKVPEAPIPRQQMQEQNKIRNKLRSHCLSREELRMALGRMEWAGSLV